MRLAGGGIQGVVQVSHKYLEQVWKCLHVGVLDDLKSSGFCLQTSEIVWKRLIQTFQIFGKILMISMSQGACMWGTKNLLPKQYRGPYYHFSPMNPVDGCAEDKTAGSST